MDARPTRPGSSPGSDWWKRVSEAGGRLRELTNALDARVCEPQPDPLHADGDGPGDECDLAQAALEQQTSAGIARLRARSRTQVERALGRLEDGTYGYCEDCGGWIDAERLEFQPETTRCVRCQALSDQARLGI